MPQRVGVGDETADRADRRQVDERRGAVRVETERGPLAAHVPIASIITPPASICAAVALKTLSLRACRFEYDEPIDHPRQASWSADHAQQEVRGPPTPPWISSGQISRTIPAKPEHETRRRAPRHALAVRAKRLDTRHPERRRRDDDRRQSARHVLLRPDDAAIAQHEHQEAEDDRAFQRVAAGHAARRASPCRSASAPPAIVQRRPPISIGGIDSRLIRMPRYVVPQIRQTASQAKSASRRSFGVVSLLDKSERPASEPRAAVDRQDLAGDEPGLPARPGTRRRRRPLPAVPHRFSGTISVIRSTASGVFHSCFAAPGDSIGPGATALTRILCRAHSTASVCVIDITPALAAAEWIVPGLPVHT